MHLVEFFLIFGIPVLTYAAHKPPKGLYFVGVGYNLLKGNPEGRVALQVLEVLILDCFLRERSFS